MDGSKVLDFEHDILGGAVFQRRILVGQLAADHLGDDLLLGHVGDVPFADVLAVAHDGDFVCDHLDLVHLVADVDQGHALAFQLPHDAEQGIDLVGGQRRGGLVQNQHLAVGRDGLGDLHHLHLRDAQGAEFGAGVDLQFEALEQLLGILVHFGVVHRDDGPKALGGVAAQPDIFGDGPGRDGLELLVHHGDAAFQSVQRGGDGDLLSFVLDLAFVHLVNAEHTFHQSGLAGAVLAHQGHDRAGAELKPGMIQSFDAGKDLDDVSHDQTVLCHSVEPPLSKT